jgi:hypothetical protein
MLPLNGAFEKKDNAAKTTQNLSHVVADLHEAHCVVEAAEACRFLVSLLRITGVQKEIGRLGGWIVVEVLVETGVRYKLFQLCPTDAHLFLLSNYTVLHDKLLYWLSRLEKAARPIPKQLDDVKTLFHIKTKSKDFQERFGHVIATVKEHVEPGIPPFPKVRKASKKASIHK